MSKLRTSEELSATANLRDSILKGNRQDLSRSITLAESHLSKDIAAAEKLIESLLTHTGKSIRIGITGSPGVGKSTFIDALGKHLTWLGKKVAVLAIDPTSQKTKGSILGDKTRMEELTRDPSAFIRPSAAGSSVGGVGYATRQSILLTEAAGFDVILVETVGVGQSEVAVRGMVDFFLLLILAGSGDDLQGIKKGIMEMADAILITKADGENVNRAKLAQADFQHALHVFRASESGWEPKVLTCSANEKKGIAEIWGLISAYVQQMKSNGYFETQRLEQRIEWFHSSLEWIIRHEINLKAGSEIKSIEKKIRAGKISPLAGARLLMKK